MKFRQAVAIVFLSAMTSLASIWGYNHFYAGKTYTYAQDSTKIPVNYARFFDGEKFGNGPADFTDAASASTATIIISIFRIILFSGIND